MYVVAGAAGNVGGAAARELLEDGDEVRVLVRDLDAVACWRERGADVAVGSLADRDFLAGALAGAKAIFTLMPIDLTATGFREQQEELADAIAGAVARSGVEHVVLLSSHGAELDRGTGPVISLHRTERLLRETGARLTAIRSGFHQENVAPLMAPASSQGVLPTLLPAELPVRMVATTDLGHVVADVLRSTLTASCAVDVQGPTYSMTDVARKLTALLGHQVAAVEVPRTDWPSALCGAGMSPTVADLFAEMYAALADGRFVRAGDSMIDAPTPIDDLLARLAGNRPAVAAGG